MKLLYPKVIYNKNGAYVTVNTEEEHEPLKAFFDAVYNSEMTIKRISYSEAMDCLKGATNETAQELAVKREEAEVDRKLKESIKLNAEKVVKGQEDKEKALKAFKPIVKNLSSYNWGELIALAKEITAKTGVKLPLRAKRDIVEQAIKEVLKDDNSKRSSN